MKSRKKDFGGCRDLISGLPDALICHILSFLPTKEAASTTVLAQRWKHLLAFVPNLEFDDSFYFHHAKTYEKRRENSKRFMHFVDTVLDLQAKAKAPPLNRFHVKCEDVVDHYHVLDWIPKVLKRGVLDIDLHIPSSSSYCSKSSFYPLPSNIFVSKTLVRLKLEFVDGVNISVAGDVSLPNLKMLHLDYFKIDTITFNKLLSGCLALEELVLVNLLWDSGDPKPCSVSIPTLKRLKFIRSDGFYEAYFHDGHGHGFDEPTKGVLLSFDNPNLVYFEYSDAIVDTCQQVSFVTLVEASLSLRDLTDQSETDISNVTKLLMGICNVKILYLSDDTLEVLAFCHETIPVFHNLIQLTIKTAPYVGWETLTALLKNCPKLQTLVFEGLNMDVRTCLSSCPVKVLKILNFGETSDDYGMDDVDDEDEDDASCDDIGDDIEEQIEQVKQLLETMPDLEELILYYNTPKAEDVIKVFKKLEKLPRVASANCNVHLKSDNLSLSFTLTKRGTLL